LILFASMFQFMKLFGAFFVFIAMLSFAANDRAFNSGAPEVVELWVRKVQAGLFLGGGLITIVGYYCQDYFEKKIRDRNLKQSTMKLKDNGFWEQLYGIKDKE